MCCGSSLNMHNMGVFETADMAVSVGPDAPIRSASHLRRRGEPKSEYSTETHLASTFTSIPCTLNLRQGTPLSQLIKIIATSRVLLDAMTQVGCLSLSFPCPFCPNRQALHTSLRI